ncbi:MAG: putative Ig domain-containing protein, partial [Planctomycetota bacterium]|jgi:hypothetical protein
MRLFKIKADQVSVPLTEFRPHPSDGQVPVWSVCTPTTVTDMSAVGYYFGRELLTELNVPVGLISSAFSGTPIEDWLPEPPDVRKAYNAMINPQIPFAMRGVIWYQGENNVISDGIDGAPLSYVAKKIELINDWRSLWGNDFPFYYAQLAPYNYTRNGAGGVLPFFWEAQADVLDEVTGTGMAVITDTVTDLNNIHPTNKEVPGTRLALLALDNTYDYDIVSTGPVFQSMVINGSTIEVYFDSAVGLTTSDSLDPDWFEIAGSDDVFYTAVATIVNEHVVLSSPSVPSPESMRFAWNEAAQPNLRNGAGLVPSAFRCPGYNNAPSFVSDPINEIDATQDSAYSSSIADDAYDPESDPMTFSKVSGPAWLSVASNGDLSGTPGVGDIGANAFIVQVDATGGSDTATLNITVNSAGNNPPYFTSDPINEFDAEEDVAYSSTIADNAFDPDSDPMTFSKVSGPAWLSVAANGDLSGTPGTGDVGANVFTVQVDAIDGSDTATLNITVLEAGVNLPPSFTSDPINEIDATQDVAYSSSIADDASDPESDPMTFSKVSGPTWLSVATDGTLSGTPGAGDVGANVFTVQVDSAGGSDTATLNITVLSSTPVGEDALIANYAGDTKERLYSNNITAVVTGVTSVSDIAFTVATINVNQNMIDQDGAATNMAYRPDFDGPLDSPITATFVVTLADGYSLTNYSVGFKENNNNAGTSTYSITANGTEIGSGSLTSTSGVDSYYNTGSVAGPLTDTITFVVAFTPGNDGTATMRADDFTLNGTILGGPVTSPPTFTSNPIIEIDAIEDAAYSSTIADDADDPEGGPMTFSKVSGPAWLTVASDGTLGGTPGDSDTNDVPNVFTVEVSATGGSATATLTIEVANIYSGAGGIEDLAGFAAQWLSVDCIDSPACGGADLDDDKDVTLSDLAIFAGNWLAGTSP